jgi:hypothetical protein
MTDTAVAHHPRVDFGSTPDSARDPAAVWVRRALQRPLVAGLLLAAIYLVASFAIAPSGEVADIGGKLATLRVMEQHDTLKPDVGYWAATADPRGDLHPLYFTNRVGDSWAQVTTLPMLYAAYPLYRVGGDRAVVLLPILGAVMCAFAARALARRLSAGDGWTAFWAVGLATPVAIYALSFWEHTIGLALMAWAVILLYDVTQRRAGTRGALGAGLLLGAAATMRTEALVYAVVATVVVCGAGALARRWRAMCTTGLAVGAGLVVVLAANQLLEQWAFGAGARSSRAAGTAAGTAGALGTRLDLATTSTTGISGFTVSIDWIVGAVAVGLIVAGVVLLRSSARRVAGMACVGVAGVLYLLRFTNGLGFVPGLLTASPLAAVGVVLLWRRRDLRLIGVLACAPVPIIWLTQFADTMRPQWGSRYLFTSGLLLAVAAVVVLRDARPALVAALVAGLVVTGLGFAFVVQRSNSIADGTHEILAAGAPAVVSLDPHFFREAGADFDPDAHWLTADSTAELWRAGAILADAGDRAFTLVAPGDLAVPTRIGGFVADGRGRTIVTRPGESLQVVEYHAA